MNLRGMREDFLYGLRGWRRTPGTLILSVLIPVIFLLAFGFIFTGPGEAALPRLAVEDLDGSPASGRLVDALAAQGTVEVVRAAPPSGAVALDWMRAEGFHGLLRVPAGFGEAVEAGRAPSASLLVATTDDAQARLLQVTVGAAVGASGSDAAPVDVRTERIPLPAPAPYSSLLLPGVIGMSVLIIGLNLSFSSISQLRDSGLLQRLAVSPMRKAEWVMARMAAQTVVSLVIATLLVLVALAAFRTDLSVTPWTALLVVGGTLVFAGLGTILGTLARTPEVGGFVLNLVTLPMVLLSGSFFDVSTLPSFLRWLPWLSPLTYLNDGLRADMIHGDHALAVLYAGALLLGSLLVVALGVRLIRWTPE